MSNFKPFVVVDRGSETQPQMVEKLNNLAEFTRVNIIILPVVLAGRCPRSGSRRETADGMLLLLEGHLC